MTETNELRCMLDEAGVEWHDDGYETTCTVWTANGITWHGLWRDGSIELLAHHLTPEQAITATVGRGTCRMVYNDLSNLSRCTACGWRMEGVPMYYCPRCGRKVVDE